MMTKVGPNEVRFSQVSLYMQNSSKIFISCKISTLSVEFISETVRVIKEVC
jgi:hypothetical protein